MNRYDWSWTTVQDGVMSAARDLGGIEVMSEGDTWWFE